MVDYDPETGNVLSKIHQKGYNDASAWARAQVWARYGYRTCYHETHAIKYLLLAHHIAKFIFENAKMPGDLVPYWDYNAPTIPKTSKDMSAAFIMASALYLLARYSHQNDYVIKQTRSWQAWQITIDLL